MPLPGRPGTGSGRQGRARWATRWKSALNDFAITFDGINQLNANCDPAHLGIATQPMLAVHAGSWCCAPANAVQR